MVKDLVCGMEIDPAAAVAKRSVNGSDYYFCSDHCAATFDADPHQYMPGAVTESSPVVEKSVVGSATTGYNSELKGPVQVELPIAGLTCSTCVTTVERSLKEVPGVEQVHVNFSLGKAHVTYNPGWLAGWGGQKGRLQRGHGRDAGADQPRPALRLMRGIY